MPTLKQKLIIILDEISFSNASNKKAWLELIDFMSEKELKETYDHFVKRRKTEEKLRIKLIAKYGLEEKYLKGIDKISDVYIQKAKNKNNKK